MFYRLTFVVTHDGYLRVSAAAPGLPVFSAILLNDKVLSVAIGGAGMSPLQAVRMLKAANEARRQPGIEICCEVVELNQRQIEALCLQPRRDKWG
jgi:hypothetical protein